MKVMFYLCDARRRISKISNSPYLLSDAGIPRELLRNSHRVALQFLRQIAALFRESTNEWIPMHIIGVMKESIIASNSPASSRAGHRDAPN